MKVHKWMVKIVLLVELKMRKIGNALFNLKEKHYMRGRIMEVLAKHHKVYC